MLNVYSRTRDGETLLSRSFRAKEFACKDGSDPCLWTANWCRCCRPSVTILAHQWSLPAATAPLHTTGLWAGRFTASISMAVPRISGCPVLPVEQLAAYAETLLPGTGGIGRYPGQRALSMWMCASKSRWVG